MPWKTRFSSLPSPNPLGAREGHISFTLGSLTETVTVKRVRAKPAIWKAMPGTLAAKMYAGINIGNTLEACDNKNKIAAKRYGEILKLSEAYVKGLKALDLMRYASLVRGIITL